MPLHTIVDEEPLDMPVEVFERGTQTFTRDNLGPHGVIEPVGSDVFLLRIEVQLRETPVTVVVPER